LIMERISFKEPLWPPLGKYNAARASAGTSIITPYNTAVITTNVISINTTRRTKNFNTGIHTLRENPRISGLANHKLQPDSKI